MTIGWTCPVCRRGVAPTEKVCDHGSPIWRDLAPTPAVAPLRGRCPACELSGICGCYQPDHAYPITLGSDVAAGATAVARAFCIGLPQ